MDITSLSAAIQTITGTFSLAKAAMETRDTAKVQDLQITMNHQLLELYTSVFTLYEKLTLSNKEKSDLENQLQELKKQMADLERYRPHTFETGTTAFVDTKVEFGYEGVYFCAACMAEGKKTILQLIPVKTHLSCQLGHDLIQIAPKNYDSVMTL